MEKYFQRSLIILSDTIRKNKEEISKEQCKLIGDWFIKISQNEVTKETISQLDADLLNIGLDWVIGY
jgi:hypothetical protein